MPDRQSVTVEQARRIAELANLTLTDDELEQLGEDLGSILSYVTKLEELDVEHVEPTAHAVPLASKLRSDDVQPGLAVDEGLANAPERIGDGFGVPKVVG